MQIPPSSPCSQSASPTLPIVPCWLGAGTRRRNMCGTVPSQAWLLYSLSLQCGKGVGQGWVWASPYAWDRDNSMQVPSSSACSQGHLWGGADGEQALEGGSCTLLLLSSAELGPPPSTHTHGCILLAGPGQDQLRVFLFPHQPGTLVAAAEGGVHMYHCTLPPHPCI